MPQIPATRRRVEPLPRVASRFSVGPDRPGLLRRCYENLPPDPSVAAVDSRRQELDELSVLRRARVDLAVGPAFHGRLLRRLSSPLSSRQRRTEREQLGPDSDDLFPLNKLVREPIRYPDTAARTRPLFRFQRTASV